MPTPFVPSRHPARRTWAAVVSLLAVTAVAVRPARAQSTAASVPVTVTVLPVALLQVAWAADAGHPASGAGVLSWTISARHARVLATVTGLSLGDSVIIQAPARLATGAAPGLPAVAVHLTAEHPTVALWTDLPLGVMDRQPVRARCSRAADCPAITLTMVSSENGLGGEY